MTTPRPKKQVIARCTPSLGAVSIWWAQAVEQLVWPLNGGRVTFNVRDVAGGEIAETRNRLVQMALAFESPDREVSHVFWVDDDVILSRLALVRLLEHDADIASGCYFTKGACGQPLIFPGRAAGVTPFVPDRVFETWGHGMGLTLVKTAVYKRLRDETDLGLDKYGRPRWYHTPGPPATVEAATSEDGLIDMGGTEDLYFLDRCARLGYKPVMDTTKWAFGFHYDLATHQGYPAEQWDQYAAGKPVVWRTKAGDVVWE